MILQGALARATAAYWSLEESIAKASRVLTDFELVKAQCVAELGYDPTQQVKTTAAVTASDGRHASQPAPRAYAASASVAPASAVRLKDEPGAPAVSTQQASARKAVARQREAGGSAGQAPVTAASAQPPLAAVTTAKPRAAAAAAAGEVATATAAAAAAAGDPVAAAKASQPAAAAAGTEAAASPRDGVLSPRSGGIGRFRLATTASGKVKLTPLQALRIKAAAAAPQPGAGDAADAGVPEQHQQQQQQQHRQQQQRRAQQQRQRQQQPAAAAMPERDSLAHMAPFFVQQDGQGQQEGQQPQKKRQRPPLPPQHRKQPREQSQMQRQQQVGQDVGIAQGPGRDVPGSGIMDCAAAGHIGSESEDDVPLEARRQRMHTPRLQQQQPQPQLQPQAALKQSCPSGGVADTQRRQEQEQDAAASAAGSDSMLEMEVDGEGEGGQREVAGNKSSISASSSSSSSRSGTGSSSSDSEGDEDLMPLAKRQRRLQRLQSEQEAIRKEEQQQRRRPSGSQQQQQQQQQGLPSARREQQHHHQQQPSAQPPAAAPQQQRQPALQPAQQLRRHPLPQLPELPVGQRSQSPEVVVLDGDSPRQYPRHQQAGLAEQSPVPDAVVLLGEASSGSSDVGGGSSLQDSSSSEQEEEEEHRQQQGEAALPRQQQEHEVRQDVQQEQGEQLTHGRKQGSWPGQLSLQQQQQQQQQQPVAQQQPLVAQMPPAAQQQSAAQQQRPGLFGLSGVGGGASTAVTKWYAVATGRRPGLYTSWGDCAGQVLGFKGAEYKSFSSEQAARQYLQHRGVDLAALQAQQHAQPAAEQQDGRDMEEVDDEGGSGQEQVGGRSRGPSPASCEQLPGSGASSRGPSTSGGTADGEEDSEGVGAGLHFTDLEAARQFRQRFNSPALQGGHKGAGAGLAGSKRRLSGAARAGRGSKKSLLGQQPAVMRAGSPGDKVAEKAWATIAKAWREKNKPSGAEIKRATQVAAAAAAERATRERRTPLERLQAERAAVAAAAGAQPGRATRRPVGGVAGGSSAREAQPGSAAAAIDAEALRTQYRHACQRKVAGITNFVEILRAFNVPTHPSKLRDAYRLAVRMYHPDSNSKDKVWRTEEQKLEAEEAMKIINERKPEDL